MGLRFLTIIGILLAVLRSGHAQNYIFNRLSIGDGLLSNNVSSVWQDQTGYLWIGSQSGLQRYDGATMRTIHYNRTDQLISDNSGRVWIRSGSRVGIFNPKSFSVVYVNFENSGEVLNPNRIWLKKDAGGRIFLVLTGINCQFFDEQKKSFSKSTSPFNVPAGLQITDVLEDPARNRYWMLASNGFGYWDKKTRSYYSAASNPFKDPLLLDRMTPPAVSRLHIDKENRFWMAATSRTGSRFLCFDGKKKRYITGATMPDSQQGDYYEVYGFGTFEDSITVAYGLNCFRSYQNKIFADLRSPANNPYGIHFNSISGVLEDREGMLWVATDNGLFYTTGNRHDYVRIILSQEKYRGTISSLAEDSRKNLWMATWGRGTYMLTGKHDDLTAVSVKELNGLDSSAKLVWTLCTDERQQIWAGCDGGKLATYDPESKKARLYKLEVFGSSAVRQLVKAENGQLWAGLQNGDIFVFDPAGPQKMEKVFSLGGPVSRMVRVGDHQLWMAVSGKGLIVADMQQKKIITLIDKQRARSGLIATIRDILPVDDKTCLIAGEKLGSVNIRTFGVDFDYHHTGQLPGQLFTLQKDRDNNIWIGSSGGIFKLNTASRMLTRYSQQDGLITVHNNSYVPERSLVLSDGRMAFGGNQHLVVFNPEEYKAFARPPDVTITGFELNDRYLPADSLLKLKTITLPYVNNAFGIDFAAISFIQRGRLTYEYKLEGLDEGWTTITSDPRVKYNFLPHGWYRFLVRARNEEGQYSATVTELQLRIKPPFWKTIWFYALVASAGAAIVFYLHRLRLQKLLHIEKVRNRLARDLHDDMGSTLSTINILSAMAQKTPDEEKSRQYLGTISRTTHQMMEAMDDIVWSINPVNDNIGRILARMKETAGTVLEPRHIDYRFEVDPSVPELHLAMESKREIFLIFKEALNNIVKYAECTSVVFTLSKKGAILTLAIADNGIGFETPAAGSAVRGNGLKNMYNRAAGLKGKLSVVSAPGEGTIVTLSIPIT